MRPIYSGSKMQQNVVLPYGGDSVKAWCLLHYIAALSTLHCIAQHCAALYCTTLRTGVQTRDTSMGINRGMNRVSSSQKNVW